MYTNEDLIKEKQYRVFSSEAKQGGDGDEATSAWSPLRHKDPEKVTRAITDLELTPAGIASAATFASKHTIAPYQSSRNH